MANLINNEKVNYRKNITIKKNAVKYSEKRVLSLFSGCGGMDIGFEGGFKCLKKSINTNIHPDWVEKEFGNWVKVKKTFFKTVFANDIKPDAKAAWVTYFKNYRNLPNDVYLIQSLVDLVKKAKDGSYTFPRDIDVVTGGFPCQDFSIAGKRMGFNSFKSHDNKHLNNNDSSDANRGKLYSWMKEVITIVKPKIFIAENVKGLVSLDNAKEIIEKDFSNACDGGYLVIPARILQAANYGVPQSRERIFFYGFKRSALKKEALEALNDLNKYPNYDPYPVPTHSFNVYGDELYDYVKCKDAFIGLDEPEFASDISQQKYSQAKYNKVGQGNIEIKLDYVSPTIRSEHHGNIEFRRLSSECGGKNLDELSKGYKQRRLTIRECARLQTFPDDYQFILPKEGGNASVSASQAYKIIGNAVPCVLGYNISKTLSEKWNMYFN